MLCWVFSLAGRQTAGILGRSLAESKSFWEVSSFTVVFEGSPIVGWEGANVAWLGPHTSGEALGAVSTEPLCLWSFSFVFLRGY